MTSNLLEILLLGSLALACACRILPGRLFARLSLAAALLSVIAVVVDLLLGNMRWQIFPAYALALLMLFASWRPPNQQPAVPKKGWPAKIAAGFAKLLVLVGLSVSGIALLAR